MVAIGYCRPNPADIALPADTFEFLTQVDHHLERAVFARRVGERTLATHWAAAYDLDWECSAYWLLMARIAEAALLCAGNYAGNCDYRAVGDLLVNLREIRIHDRHGARHVTKNRHGRLSDQLMEQGSDRRVWMKRFGTSNRLEVTKPPLLPHMAQVLRDSGRISGEYLERFQQMQCRVADTLGFMAGWGLTDGAELWRRLQTCSAAERDFALSNLCRFDTSVFQQIGRDLRRAMSRPGRHRSAFLRGGFSSMDSGVPMNSLTATPAVCAPIG